MTTPTPLRWAALAALTFSSVACSDFLSNGDTSKDPNRPETATAAQLFVGIQTATWGQYGSDLSRISALLMQQAEPGPSGSQYLQIYNYTLTENTTNGSHYQFYDAGGLVDIRKLRTLAEDQKDYRFVGISQIQEAMQMSLAADVFGDLVYSQALQGGNPPLDKQVDIYNALLVKLDSGIANVNSTATTNVGPGSADLNYGGSPAKWTALAHTLKARINLHLAELDASKYAVVLTESRLGIADTTGDYRAIYSGAAGETNLLYQFTDEQRPGYIEPNFTFFPAFVDTASPGNPRLDEFEDYDTDSGYGDAIGSPTSPQKIVSYDENTLMRAEAAYRTGATGEAQTQLDAYRAAHGIPASGLPLLQAILSEKYIAMFHQVEAWNDYKRTCYPNLTPTVAGQKIPGRLKYDTNERQTDTNIPPASQQPFRNQNDPANTADPFGHGCLGQ